MQEEAIHIEEIYERDIPSNELVPVSNQVQTVLATPPT